REFRRGYGHEQCGDDDGEERERQRGDGDTATASYRGGCDCDAGGERLRDVLADLAKLAIQVARGIVAIYWLLRQAALDGPAERRGDGGRQRRRLLANDRDHQLGRAFPVER